jgi:hypothetical protein
MKKHTHLSFQWVLCRVTIYPTKENITKFVTNWLTLGHLLPMFWKCIRNVLECHPKVVFTLLISFNCHHSCYKSSSLCFKTKLRPLLGIHKDVLKINLDYFYDEHSMLSNLSFKNYYYVHLMCCKIFFKISNVCIYASLKL